MTEDNVTGRVRRSVTGWVDQSGLRQFGWGRTLILAKALLAMAAVFYPVWWIHLHYTSSLLPSLPLSLAISFLGVQVAIIVLQLFASAAVKKLDAMAALRSAHWKSLIEPLLAAQSAGEDHLDQLRKLRRRRPVDFDACVASSLATLSGPERESLSRVALSLGVVRHWQKLARRGRMERKQAIECMTFLAPSVGRSALQPLLEERKGYGAHRHTSQELSRRTRFARVTQKETPALQATLYRALIHVSGKEELDDLFRRTLRAPFFVRALLAGEFRPYAKELGAHALCEALTSDDEEEVMAALEMVDAWRRLLYLPDLERLAHHPNPEIRCRALRAAPMSVLRSGMEETVVTALNDPHPRVKLAALTATARMHIFSAMQQVEQATHSLDNQVSRLACLVLTSFGKEGLSILQYLVVTADGRIGAWAAEALGQASAGPGLEVEF